MPKNNRMSKFSDTLKLPDYLFLIGALAVGGLWLAVDQIFLDMVYQRFIALAVLLIVFFLIQIAVRKPLIPLQYITFVALTFVSLNIVLSFIIHICIQHNFTIKSVLVWIVAAGSPFLSLFIYSTLRRPSDK